MYYETKSHFSGSTGQRATTVCGHYVSRSHRLMTFLHVKSEKGYMEDPIIPCSSPDYISDIIHHMQNVCNSEAGQYHKYQAPPAVS